MLPENGAPVVDGGSAVETPPAPSNNATETPKTVETTTTETPAAGGTTDAVLYDLPDGRKVDGATLQTVYKELLADYTPKAQKLSQFEKAGIQVADPNINKTPQNPWDDPNWVPKNYAEIVAASKEAFKAETAAEQQRVEVARQEVTKQVDTELGEIKKLEPNVSEDLLFAHATKYGFTSLTQAFANMRDLNVAIKQTQAQTQKNLNNRSSEVISTKGGAGTGTVTEGVDYGKVTNPRSNAIDFLRSLQGK